MCANADGMNGYTLSVMGLRILKILSHHILARRWTQVVSDGLISVTSGNTVSFDYLPHPIRTVAELDEQLQSIEAVIIDASHRFSGCQWSMKPSLWGLSSGLDLLRQAVERMAAICIQHQVLLRLDTAPDQYQLACLQIALSNPMVQPVLAMNSPTFTISLEQCMAHNRTPRLVKGSNNLHNSEYTEMESATASVQKIWRTGNMAAIGTHDLHLVDTVMQLPDYKPGLLEVEMVAHLATTSKIAGYPPAMIRMYHSYGPEKNRFFLGRLWHSSQNRRSVYESIRSKQQ